MAEISFTYRLEMNGRRDWRDRLGNWLRQVAWRIDGRTTLALRFESQPPMSLRSRHDVVKAGFEAMVRGMREEVRCESIERLAERELPGVWR